MAIRVGIIGAGIMGLAGGRIFKLLPDVELSAIAENNIERLAKAGAEFKISALYTDHRDMLEKSSLDAVYIATPDNFHRTPIVDSLNSGCHVLVEKPLAASQEDAEVIHRTVVKAGRKLQIEFNHRWLSPYHKVKEMVLSGQLGEPIIGYARKNNPLYVPTEMIGSWSSKTSPAWFLSCHDMDLMTWWFDADPVEVYARGIKKVLPAKGFDTYDGIHALVSFTGGKFATFEGVWIYPNSSPYMPDSYMELIGTKGTTQIDRQAEAVDAILEEKFSCPRTFLNYKVFDEWQGAMPSCFRSFIHAITHDTEPHVGSRDGVRNSAILESLHNSLSSGKPEMIQLNV